MSKDDDDLGWVVALGAAAAAVAGLAAYFLSQRDRESPGTTYRNVRVSCTYCENNFFVKIRPGQRTIRTFCPYCGHVVRLRL